MKTHLAVHLLFATETACGRAAAGVELGGKRRLNVRTTQVAGEVTCGLCLLALAEVQGSTSEDAGYPWTEGYGHG